MITKIIAIHSFRRGAGKTTLAANLAALAAMDGLRVSLLDADLQMPGAHLLFGLAESEIGFTINDVLRQRCTLEQVANDFTSRVQAQPGVTPGALFLLPASPDLKDIAEAAKTPANFIEFYPILQDFIDQKNLDLVLLDVGAGLSEETLPLLALADALVILLRPDQQDFQGTAVLLDVARQLEIANISLVMNMVASQYDLADLQQEIERAYHTPVSNTLPAVDELIALGSRDLFVQYYPNHPFTLALQILLKTLAS